ncbi:TdeIII family type II restriction endonuclease [Bacillus sp. B19-2]|uniref:TdeIII family type II restriction endonuclease n=1 Tax=Bacillus sp. B19-2 TaxID=2929516 RepID=UPI001FBBF35D|nr:TdeIII family type II restriction endonuclease [Bacillus sp. B19-2]MCJ2148429.1 TdeIII family type II restriction endonuclease [Bacillus sp. B19-2]
MNSATKKQVIELIELTMNKVIRKRTVGEPFNEESIKLNNPFGYYLVPIEVWKGSKFERSFVTTFGQKTVEQLGKIIAEGTGAYAELQHKNEFELNAWKVEKIESILTSQRNNETKPNWQMEVEEIQALDTKRYEEVRVISDLYIKRPDGIEEFYSFKTVKPNLDQTEKAKRDMLRLMAKDSNYHPYFALPSNPAGEGNLYRTAHTVPFKLFDMDSDPCVLIGSKLWNHIGQDDNTYNELIEIFQQEGKKFTDIIRKEYFGI